MLTEGLLHSLPFLCVDLSRQAPIMLTPKDGDMVINLDCAFL